MTEIKHMLFEGRQGGINHMSPTVDFICDFTMWGVPEGIAP